jgi:hypothetical protein
MCQHWSFPHILLTWLQLVFTCSINCNQHCRDGTSVMLVTSLRMQRKSWTVFHKMASRNVSNTLTVAGREYRYTRGLFWRKCKLKWLYCFVLLTNRKILWTFWSYHILHSGRDPQKLPTHFSTTIHVSHTVSAAANILNFFTCSWTSSPKARWMKICTLQMDERTILLTSSFTDSRISLFSFFSYHFSTKTKPLICVPPNPPALWIVTIFRASLSFIPPEILHLDQNHRTGTLGWMSITSND